MPSSPQESFLLTVEKRERGLYLLLRIIENLFGGICIRERVFFLILWMVFFLENGGGSLFLMGGWHFKKEKDASIISVKKRVSLPPTQRSSTHISPGKGHPKILTRFFFGSSLGGDTGGAFLIFFLRKGP